jgi:hypothetical protein
LNHLVLKGRSFIIVAFQRLSNVNEGDEKCKGSVVGKPEEMGAV